MNILRKIKNRLSPAPYFLVMGAGRGGTSLLAAMLDSHPKLSVGMEMFAFDYLLAEKIDEKEKDSLIKRVSSFNRACENVASSLKTLWGNKITSEQVFELSKCEGAVWPNYFDYFLSKTVGKNKVVFIVRDGRSCVQSKLNRTEQGYSTALKRWKYSISLLKHLQKTHGNLHVVYYEQLVENPKRELEKLATFFNVPFAKEMLEGHKNKILPDIYKGQELKINTSQNWSQNWTDDMRVELTELGYL